MELVHVLTRGVDKRNIFLDDQDYFRFIHDLFEFNDIESTNMASYFFKKQYFDVGRRNIASVENIKRKPRKLLVRIHAFCLMPNHYHLLLSPIKENGVALFMKKINGGYVKYFNEKYKRKGTLFEGKYKRILAKDESHFIHLPYYIHFNPLDFKFSGWRKRELKNYNAALRFLDTYRWSSHLDYLGNNNFPSVTQRDFLMQFFDGPKGYKESIRKWLRDIELDDIQESILE